MQNKNNKDEHNNEQNTLILNFIYCAISVYPLSIESQSKIEKDKKQQK